MNEVGSRRESQPAAIAHGDKLAWVLVGLCLALASLLRWRLSQSDRVVWGDEPFYLWLGRNWITGQGYSFTGHPDVHHVPLFPWLAGLVFLATHNTTQASNILYTVFGSLLVLPMYAVGRQVYGRRVAVIAAALTAVFPALSASVVHWGSLTEPIYMFFVYVGLWALLMTLRPLFSRRAAGLASVPAEVLWPYAVAGVAFGAAYLTRPEGFNYWALYGVGLLVGRLLLRRWNRRFAVGLAIYALAFSVAFVPYAIYTHRYIGAWMVSEKVGVTYLTGIGLAHGDTSAFDKSTWGLDSTGLETFFFSSESYNVSMLALVLDDPRAFLSLVYGNLTRFAQVLFDWTVFPAILAPLVVLGLFTRGWSRRRAMQESVLLVSVAPVAAFVLFFIQARYLVTFVPVLVLWCAAGLGALDEWLVGTFWPANGHRQGAVARRAAFLRVAVAAVAPSCVLVGLVALQPLVVRRVLNTGSVRIEHKRVGETLGLTMAPETVLMSRYPAIAYHAGVRWAPSPNAPVEQVLAYARHKGARYWAIDERELRYRPQVGGLVSGVDVPYGLRLMYVSTAGGERLVVYELAS